MKQQNTQITTKSTKEQILAAYQDTLQQLQQKFTHPQEQKKQEEEKKIVAKAVEQTDDRILQNLSQLKMVTIKQIDGLSESLLEQFNILNTLKKAIDLEQSHLQEIYQIKENAHSLSALIQAQQEERKRFEDEMFSYKQKWKSDKEILEVEYKELREKLEKERQRNEEEYKYKTTTERRKEEDLYQQKKQAIEKELSALSEDLCKREEILLAKEKEYAVLQEQVAKFPDQLQEAVTIAEETLRKQIEQQHSFESQLKAKENEGIVCLLQEKIAALTLKVKEQDMVIKELNQRSTHATTQVQEIACKALDASATRMVVASSSKGE
jgi:hypothetical protein